MKNTVTRDQIDALLAASQVDVCTKFDKVTVVTVRLPNGFVLVESSGAVDKANYSESIGAKTCLERIAIKLWQFEGYRLSSLLAEAAELNPAEIDAEAFIGLPVAEAVALRDAALELASAVEAIPASAEATTASVAASALHQRLVAIVPPVAG